MWHFRLSQLLSLLVFTALSIGCTSGEEVSLKADVYKITAYEDELSEQWAYYLFNHLGKRAQGHDIVFWREYKQAAPSQSVKTIKLKVVQDLPYDYEIDNSADKLSIRISTQCNALWMVYQLINRIAEEDERINAQDLPPATISFHSHQKKFDFAYREPYFFPNMDKDYAAIIGANNLNRDWAIWGHNLSRILGEELTPDCWALIQGKRTPEQLCFTSSRLEELISVYINKNYGNEGKTSARIMIAPNDNLLVCQCNECKKVGNTSTNSTPAVADMLLRLAKKFPYHEFYTIAYHTTKQAPEVSFLSNIGVFLSTIDLPKGVELGNQKEVKAFKSQVEGWRSATDNIYLWDYAANFDDYLTPLPQLYAIKKQLVYFKELGIKGIFFNASGEDYASFNDLNTYVIAALMQDTNHNVDTLVTNFFRRYYPNTHQLLAEYWLASEKTYAQKKIPYNMYGGMAENLNSYFDPQLFIPFYNQLTQLYGSLPEGDEKLRIKQLTTALSFTYLQLAYFHCLNQDVHISKQDVAAALERLNGYISFPNMIRYNEAGSTLKDYLAYWPENYQVMKSNKLRHAAIEILSPSESHKGEACLLYDGMHGLPFDYHQGWFISSAPVFHVRLLAQHLPNAKQIRLRFLQMKRHGFYPPQAVEVWGNGTVIQHHNIVLDNDQMSEDVIFPVDFSKYSTIELKMYNRELPRSAIACDEIDVE